MEQVTLGAADALDRVMAAKIANAVPDVPEERAATVLRVGADGRPVVHIAGGADETECEPPGVAVAPGDSVRVVIQNRRARITANASRPATDDSKAVEARLVAVEAGDTALRALEDAAIASESARSAEASAARAFSAASSAQDSAVRAISDAAAAKSAADAAQASADAAGTAAASAQSEADAAKSAADSAVSDAAGARSSAERAASDAAAAKSTAEGIAAVAEQAKSDAAAAKGAADSARSDAAGASRAANDALSQLSTVQDVVGTVAWAAEHSGEDMASYIGSHLALTDAGLWVTLDGDGYKLLLASDGARVYDPEGRAVSTFGESIAFDSSRPQRIGNDEAYIEYYDSDGDGAPDAIRMAGTSIDSEIAQLTAKADTLANPNLSPFFSVPKGDGAYWVLSDNQSDGSSDGWMTFDVPDANAAPAYPLHIQVRPASADWVRPGGRYTLLMELQDVETAGTVSFMPRADGNVDQVYLDDQTMRAMPTSTVRLAATAKPDALGNEAYTSLMAFAVRVADASSFKGRMRLSLYEGAYDGPYKPYVGNLAYATAAQATELATAIEQTAESISSLASRTEVDLLSGSVDILSTAVTQTAGSVDTLVTRMTAAEDLVRTAGNSASEARALSDALSTLIRQYGGGVEVGRISNGAYVGTRTVQTPDGTDILLADGTLLARFGPGGTTYYDPSTGKPMAAYSKDGVTLGDSAGMHMGLASSAMSFLIGNAPLASFGMDSDSRWRLTIADAYIQEQLRFGSYAWYNRSNGNMTLKYIGA